MSVNTGIPNNWIVCTSNKQVPSRKYFFNLITGDSRWEPPSPEDLFTAEIAEDGADIIAVSVKKEVCSPESTTDPEKLAKNPGTSSAATDTLNNNSISNSMPFDLRQVLNWKRHLKMDWDFSTPSRPNRNLAQRRMVILKEELNKMNNPDTHTATFTAAPSCQKGQLNESFLSKPKVKQSNQIGLPRNTFVGNINNKTTVINENTRSTAIGPRPEMLRTHENTAIGEQNNNRKRKYPSEGVTNITVLPNKDPQNNVFSSIQHSQINSNCGFSNINNEDISKNKTVPLSQAPKPFSINDRLRKIANQNSNIAMNKVVSADNKVPETSHTNTSKSHHNTISIYKETSSANAPKLKSQFSVEDRLKRARFNNLDRDGQCKNINLSSNTSHTGNTNNYTITCNVPSKVSTSLHNIPKQTDNFNKTIPNNEKFNCDDDSMNIEENVLSDSLQEQMEWETITEEKILSSIDDVRKELSSAAYTPGIEVLSTIEIKQNQCSKLHIVIDTNIFLSCLPFVQHILMDYKFDNFGCAVLIIPWTVLQELDYIKDKQSKCDENGKLAVLARKAIAFLNNGFRNKNPNFYGQTAVESSRVLFKIDSSDDNILNCCLQIKERAQEVVLLSNDKNLRTKAMICNISAYSKDDIIKSIKTKDGETFSSPTNSPNFNKKTSNQKDYVENVTSAISKAPNLINTHKSCNKDTYITIDQYVKDIVQVYKSFCVPVMEICRKHSLGVPIDKETSVIKTLPKMLSLLHKFLDTINRVTVQPFYFVKIHDLQEFCQLVTSFLKENQVSCDDIPVKAMANYCRDEREKLLALERRLKSVLKILRQLLVLV